MPCVTAARPEPGARLGAPERRERNVIMRIAVAGATGRVGHHVVDVLAEAGHDVVAMSRGSGVDVVTGEGLATALAGVECVVDATSGPSPEQRAATEFFTASARNLQEIGARAGVRRIVVVSIIGVDRFEGGYMTAKLAHEQALRAGPVPVRILRAAQFHEFVAQLVEWGRQGAVSYLPKMWTQLVAARAVAEGLARLATERDSAQQAAGAPFLEIAGPRDERLAEAATRLVARRRDVLSIEEVTHPADPDSARYANGALLPGPGAVRAGPTFDAWLEATF
jgi:uncharacterized protein YbjT (DUF2867 family)